MVENPNNPVLNLDVQKMQSWVAPSKLMYEGDKGYNQPFRLTNNWNAYNVTANNLCFTAMKPDGNVIDIQDEPSRFSQKDGIWYFKIPNELTQAIGQVKCFFYIKDEQNNIVASTTKFAYMVEAKFTETEESISYVTILERLQRIFETYIENAKNEVNEMDAVSEEYKQKLLDLLNKLQKQTDDWLKAKTAEIDADIKVRQDALDKLNADYQAKYNELVTNWNNQMTAQRDQYNADKIARDTEYQNDKKYRDDTYTADKNKRDADFTNEQATRANDWDAQKQAIQDKADKQYQDNQDRADQQNVNIQNQADAQKAEYEADKKKRDDEYLADKTSRDTAFNQEQADRSEAWSNQSKAIDDDYKAKLAEALKDIQDQRDAKISQIDQEWTDKKTSLQNDIDTFKSDLLTKVQDASDQVKKLIETDLPAMNQKADEVQAKVDKLAEDFSTVDWDSYAKKVDVYAKTETYNKEEINNLIDNGGKVKSATINGGEKILPNEEGNLALSVPDPDLSDYPTKEEVNTLTDLTKIKFRKQFVNGSGQTADKTWSARKNDDGTYTIDLYSDDWTASKLVNLISTVSGKADKTTVEALTTTVNGKANQSAVDELTTTVNNKGSLRCLTQSEYNALWYSEKTNGTVYMIYEE